MLKYKKNMGNPTQFSLMNSEDKIVKDMENNLLK